MRRRGSQGGRAPRAALRSPARSARSGEPCGRATRATPSRRPAPPQGPRPAGRAGPRPRHPRRRRAPSPGSAGAGRRSPSRAGARRRRSLGTRDVRPLPRHLGYPGRGLLCRQGGGRRHRRRCGGRRGRGGGRGDGRRVRRRRRGRLARRREPRSRSRGGSGSGSRSGSRRGGGGLGRGGGGGSRPRRRRGRGSRRRRRDCPRGQEGEGIDVRLSLSDPDAEVDVGDVVLGFSRRPGAGDRLAFANAVALPHAQRAEVGERRPVAVAGRDRDRQPVRGQGAGEGHLARDRRPDLPGSGERDIDPPVLPAGVRIRPERELAEDRPVCRPGPGERAGCDAERPRRREQTGDHHACCRSREHAGEGTGGPPGRQGS